MKTLINELKKIGITRETVRRTARTFMQTALGYIVANLGFLDFSESKEVIKAAVCGLVVSAIAAGIAAVMNIEKRTEEA